MKPKGTLGGNLNEPGDDDERFSVLKAQSLRVLKMLKEANPSYIDGIVGFRVEPLQGDVSSIKKSDGPGKEVYTTPVTIHLCQADGSPFAPEDDVSINWNGDKYLKSESNGLKTVLLSTEPLKFKSRVLSDNSETQTQKELGSSNTNIKTCAMEGTVEIIDPEVLAPDLTKVTSFTRKYPFGEFELKFGSKDYPSVPVSRFWKSGFSPAFRKFDVSLGVSKTNARKIMDKEKLLNLPEEAATDSSKQPVRLDESQTLFVEIELMEEYTKMALRAQQLALLIELDQKAIEATPLLGLPRQQLVYFPLVETDDESSSQLSDGSASLSLSLTSDSSKIFPFNGDYSVSLLVGDPKFERNLKQNLLGQNANKFHFHFTSPAETTMETLTDDPFFFETKSNLTSSISVALKSSRFEFYGAQKTIHHMFQAEEPRPNDVFPTIFMAAIALLFAIFFVFTLLKFNVNLMRGTTADGNKP